MALLRFRPFGFFCVYLLSITVQTEGRQIGSAALQEDYSFLTIQQSSLLPSDTCNTSTPESGGQTILKLVNRHGPCSSLNKDLPNPLDVLLEDQVRVSMIQKMVATASVNGSQVATSSVDLPLYSGATYGTANYIVQVRLGTPSVLQSLLFDTGSRTTWVQCQPCFRCHAQKDPLFNPSQSSTYNQFSCLSPACSASPFTDCSGTLCAYKIVYGDKSYAVGVLSSDTLTLSDNDVIPNYIYGCSNDVQGLFQKEAGLLGFSNAPLSFVSQTSSRYNGVFSYCIPSTESSTGFLAIGSIRSANQQPFYVPFSSQSYINSFYYAIDITGISVGGTRLQTSLSPFFPEPIIVDSGTVITRLSAETYSGLRDAYSLGMSAYPTAGAVSILDTCFDLRGYNTITVPRIVFTFNNAVDVRLPSSLTYVGNSRFCLAYAPTTDVSILGNTQQKTLEIVFDTFGKRLGFRSGGCG